MVSGSSDKTLRSWDAAGGTAAGGPMTGHAGAVRSVATGLLVARQVAVSGGDDGTARVWDLATGQPVGKPACHDTRTLAVATAERDGRPVIISGSDSGTGHLGDLAAGYPVSEVLTASAGSVCAVAVTQLKDGPVFATGGANGIVRRAGQGVAGTRQCREVRLWPAVL